MSVQLREIQKKLRSGANVKDAGFFQKMVPGKQKVYGVKTPTLNALAQEYRSYSFELATELWKSGALEEKVIAIKIIEKAGRKDPARVLKLFKLFSKDIDNWAVCDGLGMQFLRSIVKTHTGEIFALAGVYNKSTNPWQRRLSLVMVEWYTRNKEYTAAIKELVENLEGDEEYYVKKAVVWIKKNFAKGK